SVVTAHSEFPDAVQRSNRYPPVVRDEADELLADVLDAVVFLKHSHVRLDHPSGRFASSVSMTLERCRRRGTSFLTSLSGLDRRSPRFPGVPGISYPPAKRDDRGGRTRIGDLGAPVNLVPRTGPSRTGESRDHSQSRWQP